MRLLADGRIAAVEDVSTARSGDLRLAGKALMPGTINAHCHTFQALLRGLGDDLDFMGWRDRVLYPFSGRLDRRAIALGAQLAFAEQLLHGVTTSVDFFLKNVVYAMSPQAVTDVWVHGRRVVEHGRLVTVDVAELLARVRELTKEWRVGA